MSLLLSFIEGFVVSIGLIVAIGPQNAYVLRQGIRQRHAAQVAGVCFVIDATLITLGVVGVGKFIASNETLSMVLGWGGVLFLGWFAARSIKAAIKPEVLDAAHMDAAAGDAKGGNAKTAMMHAAAFSLLNPWVYMDTMVLIGGVSVRYATDGERLAFLIGAVLASFVWFFGLALGGKKMAPLFQKTITWRVLDSFIAFVMIAVALNLIRFQLA